MNMQGKRDFLTNAAYWAVVIGLVYLGFEYLMPISVPFLLGIPVAWLVVWLSRKLHCTHKLFRIGLTILIYGLIALLITLLAARGVTTVTAIIKWLPEVYEMKLLPFITLCYNWFMDTLHRLDPELLETLEMLLDSLVDGLLAALKDLISVLSGSAVSIVSGIAVGIPDMILSLLAMIFSTVFTAIDYEGISAFAAEHLPRSVKTVLGNVRIYLTETLFVVIRSYVLIMLLTFAELAILFKLFGIESAVLKASVIALLDIMPILGTGGIMIPWGIISLALGYTKLGIQLLLIYVIVTVIRNYVEPRIVGVQLGLHPIITLVSMFIGLRLFGFWGLFGLPVGISFLWKQKLERDAQMQAAKPE
ncbi:MAG: AI-2E family transporter [Oscillospiraceae bacterium]|nr:AI-2E family transporter [Oscillospiraceae bacterium]MBQ7130605.1 AI-2E family transporter [Oscillospiraceae bacterium]